MFIESIYNNRHLHIVSFDIPFPPTYGGVIDVFFKLKCFKKFGIKVHLHCFKYGRNISSELEKICESVTYYKRGISKANLFRKLPYIVVSRTSEEMMKNLLADDYPILFEGLHTCYYLNDKRLKGRKKIVRTHNIEHDYYLNLARVEKSIFKRYYFYNESVKLKHFEEILNEADGIAAISKNDQIYLSSKFDNVRVISAFHPSESVQIKEGLGEYALYHGTLSIGENNDAALYLINKVFNDIDVPLVIAGSTASAELKAAISKHVNVRLKGEVTHEKIFELIENAQINILPTFQATGIKLKLLAALFRGRHCLVNTPMVTNTGLENLCVVADTPQEMKNEIQRLFSLPFTQNEIDNRNELLNNKGFTNDYNMKSLLNLIFD